MSKTKPYSLLIIAILALCVLAPYSSYAQQLTRLEFQPQQNPALKRAAYDAIRNKVDYFNDKYGMGFHLYFAFADLNADGKDEIFLQLNEQYEFRDNNGNVDTHVFAQTSTGFKEILEVQAQEIAIGMMDTSRLKQIYAYKAPRMNDPIIYSWNGQDKYLKDE